ncbi:type II toxin-antitoxin system mRNA interferase toxin, RelE/StbE family [Aureimonas sp. OT7]|uniref:type II toxin-antitoxin system RelE family toxin n=1 Tax=Aureimonas sp. OT7 TaxID=2816454 RepID=UPI001783C132|nr:type II toxin-antitoxin system mRNA interferase toxin, RelE/StbE family [Aureimonas sp. OT7]QOG05133.1 type II toxin-antitoxin system mRNA interferase toxin, RelE/StbE family [Aureimonas sp. OT7]
MKAISYTTRALRSLSRMPRNVATRIQAKVEQFAADPASLANNVKALKGEISGTYRLRVGDYRVIFNEHGVVLVVLKVGHRRDIYE